ncbi:hypothetical protein NAT47_12255 [Flavobacterium sp. HXWNR69]|uniref:Uncharacterized protein n=1 Tax=Flavobacterium fragile TaxID=2949085 RepID=A0ABT0TJK4_9FLAO|nr:hypothetical protein [Flavobacterium sp. HXWNR69]MCL9771186.1 hypothetical protein [Flavobacterium sp. HXWNR69]
MSKKITLLVVASLFQIGSMAYASENPVFTDNTNKRGYYIDYRDAEPIIFRERGIEFMLFPNGEFDFNTRPSETRYEINRTNGAPRSRGYYGPSERGIRVEHDNFGRVRRVGNVYINYDAFGRVKRIGTIYMSYNSFAVTRVGNMRIVYDRRGRIIEVYGFINYANNGYVYTPSGTHYSGGNSGGYGYDDDYGSDEDYYYYRKDGSKAKMTADDVKEIKRETLETKKDK